LKSVSSISDYGISQEAIETSFQNINLHLVLAAWSYE